MYNALSNLGKKAVFLFVLLFLTASLQVQAQNCSEINSFEVPQYDPFFAKYAWSNEGDASYYTIQIEINNQPFLFSEFPAGSTDFEVQFSPNLKHNDHVEAQLVKYCTSGNKTIAYADFIVITDAIVYLIGDPKNGGTIKVEPVEALKDNLDPAEEICGLCAPEYFRLTSGFYAPMGIAVSTGSTLPIEQVRFDKSELCGCLKDAISAGVLNPDGGPGPQYNGAPFACNLTPYAFEKVDCERKSEGRSAKKYSNVVSDNFSITPNPITHDATINFSLSTASLTQITIYDLLGNPVKTILPYTSVAPGDHQMELSREDLPAGVYYCSLRASDQVKTIKLLVIN